MAVLRTYLIGKKKINCLWLVFVEFIFETYMRIFYGFFVALSIGLASPLLAATPVISSVAIPNAPMKVGQVVTATITVTSDAASFTLISGTIGGFTLTSLNKLNNTSYEATFIITNGGTDVAAVSDIPVSNLVLADAALQNTAYTQNISQAGDPIDANLPTISSVTIPNVSMKVNDVVTATITVGNDGGETYTLTSGTIGGFPIGSFTRINSTSYTATFTIANGGADVPAASNIPVSLIISDVATNPSITYTTAISQGTDPIDANAPVITNVSIPPVSMKVNDVVTATITVADDGGETYTLNTSTIGGFTLGALARSNSTTYTATFTITNGGTDIAAGSNIPVSVSLSDEAGSPSSAYTTAISQGGDPIDANNPAAPSTPDLAAADDSNIDTDNVTNITTNLTFTGTAENGSTVQLYNAGTPIVGATAVASPSWSIDINLSAAVHSITAIATDAAGNLGPASSALGVTVDTSPPAPPGSADLTSGTDSQGVATGRVGTNSDNITNSANPTFTGTGANGNDVVLFSSISGSLTSGVVTGSVYTIGAGAIVEGAHSITAHQRDLAGNLSTPSAGLAVTIDRTRPTISGTPVFSPDCAGCTNGNRESILISFSENIDLGDGLDAAHNSAAETGRDGFIPSAGDISNSNSIFTATTDILRFASVSNNQWNSATTFTYNNTADQPADAVDQHPNYVHDIAGNEMATVTFGVGDNIAVGLASGFLFFPNAAAAETIVVRLTEELNLANGASVTGFTTNPVGIASALYSGKGTTNTITFTSTGNGVWTDGVTISYLQASGNVLDLTGSPGNELAAFSNSTIRLINVNIVSNNANGFTNRAKPGDQITLTYTNTGAAPTQNVATIDGMNAMVTGGGPGYSATLTTSASNSNGAMPFRIDFEIGSDSTSVNATTNTPIGSVVTFDKNVPLITPITILSNNANTALARTGNTVSLTFTVNETLFGTPVVTIAGRTATVGNAGLVYTATLLLNGTETEGVLPFNISLQDQVGNLASATATTNASSVNYNKTAPTVTSITLLNPSPTSNTSVDFQVVFSEAVAGVNASDFSTFGTASSSGESISNVTGSGTTYTITVSGIGTIGSLGLTLVDNNSIIDQHSNSLGGTALNDGDFSSPNPYQIALPAPSNHAIGFSISSITFSSMQLSWNNPFAPAQAASGYLITIARSGATAQVPLNGTPVLDQADLINNTTGYINVPPGSPFQTLAVSSLLSGETYTVMIYPYTNSGPAITYKIDGTVPSDTDASPLANNVWINNNVPLEPASFPVTTTTSGLAVVNFRFMIEDDAWDRPGPENASTKITSIRIRRRANDQIGNWNNALAGVELTDGVTTKTGVIDPAGNFVTFSGLYNGTTELFGEVADNAIKYYSLKLILKTPLTGGLSETIDNKSFVFEMNNADLTLTSNSSGLNPQNDISWPIFSNVNNNKVIVTSNRLEFTTNPIPAVFVLANVTAPLTAPDLIARPVVRARDAFGNTDLDYNASVAVTNAGSIPMLALLAPNNLQAVNGVIQFPVTFRYSDDGNGTLTVSDGSFTAVSIAVAVNYSNTSTITAGTFAEPVTFSSLRNDLIPYDLNLNRVFDFSVNDDNNAGGDLSPTRISQVIITQGTGNDVTDWTQAFEGAVLFDGVNQQFGTITANSLTFTVTPTTLGLIGDNASKNYQLYIRLKSAMGGSLPSTIDNLNLVFEVLDDNITLESLSSLFTGSEEENSGASNVAMQVLATKMAFITQPSATANVDADLSIQPVVEATDAFNNRDLDYGAGLVVSNAGSLTMVNTPTSFATGLITFPANFQYRNAGNGTLTVISGALTPAVSSGVTVSYSGQSDIVRDGTFSYPINIPYINHLAANIIQDGNSIDVERFILRDGGATANDLDGAGTRAGSLTIQITNGTNLRGLALYDGSTELGEVTPVAGIATFTGLTLTAPDNDIKVFTLRASFLNTVTDNQVISFQITSVTATAGIGFGSDFTAVDGGGAQSIVTGNQNRIEVVASQLHFTTPSSAANASLDSPFAVTVQARDANNNLDVDFTSAVTSLSNATNATMSSAPAVVGSNFIAGVLNFPANFQFTTGSNNDNVTLSITAAGAISSVLFPAPFTPKITLRSSFESLFVVDPAFTPTLDLPYIDYQNISTAATSIALAQFKLIDGNGTVNDSDGAATNINDIQFSITNPANIRSLGIYLGSTLIQSRDNAAFVGNAVSFTGLSGSLIAPDNNSLIVTVRASFFNTAANVTDNQVIQLQTTSVAQSGGSQFNNIGSSPLIGGITNGAVSAGNVRIEVTATRLDYVIQPLAFEGIQQPLAVTPQVQARDVNQIVDLDHNFVGNLSAVSASLTTTAFAFANGVVSFTGLQYVAAGDGTITITSNGLSSATGGSIACIHVDVINVFSTYAPTGVITSPNLPGGAVNRVIFGVTFNTPYKVTGEPKLNRFTINFSNPIAGVLTNLRLFESVNTAFDGTDVNITTPSIGGVLTAGANFITVDFTGGTPRDLSLPVNAQLTYFLQVDVSPAASGSTPKIRPSVANNSVGIITSNGSIYSTQNTLGQEYSFASIFPPTLVGSYPATGQLNVDKNQPTLDLVFSVPVWTLDSKISLFDQSTGLLVQTLNAVNGAYAGGNTANLAGTQANPLKFSLPPLLDDRVYYVTIAQGDVDNFIGIADESLNEFPGFTFSGTLYFKTANPNPPILLNNNSTPVANNPKIESITLTGATIIATFDQQGIAYFMVVNQGAPTPTNAQITGASIYIGGTVIDRGQLTISQVNPLSQFGQIIAPLATNTNYDVWMFAENNALPTPISTTAPYGSVANSFSVGGAGPTLTFTTPATAQPSGPVLPIPQVTICRNSFQILNLPLQLVEGNPADFSNGSTQVFNLLLPSGFQFDVTTTNSLPTGPPVYGQLTLTGSDFIGLGTIAFINNTTLRVSFRNFGSTSRDNITISGLRILANSVVSGNIVRLGGNAILSAFPDLTPIATISSFDASSVEFTNAYSKAAFPGAGTPITIIPDDQGQVELIPLPDPGDYGPNAFSGSGVNINQLNVTAVTKDSPFNITLTHADNNGCISQNPIQYTIYDSQAAIKGLSPKFCIDNLNFPANATLGTGPLTQTVLKTNLGAHLMDTLKAKVPFNANPNQKIFGLAWETILNQLPVPYNPVPDANNASRFYRDFRIDGAMILNANTLSGGVIPNPYSHFINTTPQGGTYYDGGTLGFVEFTGQYQNQANGSVYIPLRQNVEFFVPAVPIVETGLLNRTNLATGVPIYCEQGGKILINGFPAASVGSSVGFFSLENAGTIIHARDLTVAITLAENNGGNFQITLSKAANLLVGNSIQIFGVSGTLPVSATHVITAKISNTQYVINRPFSATILNAAKITISLTGFVDNSNGTAEMDPSIYTNSYANLRINYTYKSNDSPCESTGGLTMRVEPNPTAQFTFGSAITANTPLSTALCEGIPVNFNGSGSTITTGTITSYNWDFTDGTNSTGANPNIVSGVSTTASHIFTQSALYAPTLVATSSFGCKSGSQSVPLNVGIIPVVEFNFSGVSTATPISFTNTTVIPPGSVGDGITRLRWNYNDGNTATVTSNFGTAIANPYANPGKYNARLEVISLLGCTNELAQKVIVVPQVTPTDLIAYDQGFETNGGGWQTDGFGATPSTWVDGIPAKQVISLMPNNGQRIWTTGLNTPYDSVERSALYSPSFNLSELDRPMISFNSFRHLAAGEGVVVEYSIDNKNIADPTKQWTVLGQLINGNITGVSWYNGVGLSSQPGNQTTGLGWTGADTEWRESKHVLDAVLNQSQVVFRFALATLTATPTLDGFAIDNVRVGNRTRTILLENFKNLGRSAASNELAESNYLKTFKQNAIGTKLVKINYHVGFPQPDPFNQDNAADPSSRALYYNIESTPIARLDGNNAPAKTTQPFSDWGEAWYDEQTLKLANAIITPTPTVNSDGSISISVNLEAISITLPANTVLHVAVVEKLITSVPAAKQALIKTGETNYEFVLKKLLPSGAGTVLGQPLAAGDSRTFSGFEWIPESSRLYPSLNDLAVVAFVQNEITREVYQAEIVDVGNDPPVVTGLKDVVAEQINVYPNPASESFVIEMPAPVENQMSVNLVDLTGRSVHELFFEKGEQSKSVNTQELAGGIYILQIGAGKAGVIRKKVMIVHQN